MMTRRFPKDPGLTARMLVVMFMLGLLYVVFVTVLFNATNNLTLVLFIAGVLLFSQYYFSDKIALFSMGAKEVSPSQAPELHAIIDRLCALSDTHKPRVAMANTDMPNAFATGRSPKHAVVCVTTGLMRRLDEAELEGVIAHELAHVAHRDVAVMTIASFLGMAAGMITRFAMYGGMGHGHRDRENNNGAAIVLLVSVLVYCVSFVLTRALSRYRELSADRSGAFLTGAPSALASALQKITGTMAQIPTRDLRAAEPLNAFFFAPAAAPGRSMATLFSTHPPLERRLAQLAKIEAELGRGV